MTRPYSRVTRQTVALLLSGRGAPRLVVYGTGLGLAVYQYLKRRAAQDEVEGKARAPREPGGNAPR